MGKALKNIGFFLVTITITGVIFWFVFLDKESKSDVLEYSLNLLGDRLMAMVPENSDRASIKTLYDKFVKQTKAKEVAPEQVEYVAANILNLSNLDTTLTPEQAEAVLKFSLEAPLKLERINDKSEALKTTSEKAHVTMIVTAPSLKEIPQKKWDDLGIRIQELNKMNDELNLTMRDQAGKKREEHLHLHYRIDNGLRITLDPRMKEKLMHKKYRRLSKDISRMEDKHLLEWRKNFRKEMEDMRLELNEFRQLEELEKLKKLKELKVLGSLEALKALEGLEFIPQVINADSIQAIVNKGLDEAGIIKKNNK